MINKLKKKLWLPSCFINSIYRSNPLVNLWVDYATMPVGYTYDKVRTLITGRDNETHDDWYEHFFIASVELVDKKRLPARQLKRLEKDHHLCHSALYLATIYEDLDKEHEIKQRQVFLNSAALRKIGIEERPTENKPIGNNTSLLSDNVVEFTIRGRYWGWDRPITQGVTIKAAQQEILDRINKKLKDPHIIVRRSPLPFFSAPAREVVSVLIAPIASLFKATM